MPRPCIKTVILIPRYSLFLPHIHPATGPLSSDPTIPPVSNASPHSGISPSTDSAITNISSNANNDTVDNAAAAEAAADDDNQVVDVEWQLCDGPLAVDYIPCLDNWKAIKALRSRKHMEHRERHCPDPTPRCLIPLPQGYKVPVPWPKSRDMIWYSNVPHPKLVEYKKDQRWVLKSDDYFIFPGGGTQFKNGVNYYIESIVKMLAVVLLASSGALLDKNVITMSFAPKDEHEAQIQFALERGIPATLSVIGTQRLTFPDNSYDVIHCARCRVHWDGDAMVALSESICWSIAAKTYVDSSQIGIVIFQKPVTSSCYQNRKENNPPLCDLLTRPNNSWYVPLDSCLVPIRDESLKWPSPWPVRLSDKPPSLSLEPDAEETFKGDTRHWSALVSEVYLGGLDLNWSNVRNVMDMNAGYGGCDIIEVAAEMDRILRPGGYLVVQDTMEMLTKVTLILKSLHWSISVHQDQFLVEGKSQAEVLIC
ncbi:hypothetical protein DH2020_044239 [Rehmannia glutinosa]|uniref:Methyltransferase n=1 Tax=Rehmannia glutinosa TaxID=99300 RepID=A0ABR0UJ41_REHGL